MSRQPLLLPVVVFTSLLGCVEPPEERYADLVLRGGAVHTMDEERSVAESVAVAEGVLVFVGSDEAAELFIGPETRVQELDGRMVLPGFHDAHVHPVSGGVELGQCDLNAISSRDDVLEKIATCAESGDADEWVVGGGWDLPLFPDGNPSRTELDSLAPGRPVYLSSADGHSAWVSTEALARAGIDRDTPNPVGGRIERDPRTGEATGTLRESAMGLVGRHVPPVTPEERAEGLRRALRMANRFGITSLVEASGSANVLAAYESLARSGELTARVRVSLHVDERRDEEQVEDLIELRERAAASGVRADAAKIFADGVIEGRTAALLEPYVGLDHAGELNFEPERLNRIVARLDASGFQVHVHAIGDRAIRVALDAFEHAREENGVRDARHHVAHIQLFHPDDIPRFAELGVVANFQPLWAYADSYITELTEPVLGAERSRWLYPIRSLHESGAVVAAGSDWSVSSMNPLHAIQVALTRRAIDAAGGSAWIPEEIVGLDTMLAAYTRNGAWLMHQEGTTGTIEPGKAADLIVLDRDLHDVPPEAIHDVEVLLTLLAGEEVYRSDRFSVSP